MQNLDVAAALNEMASLLEIKGDSPFKVRAYRTGAAAIQALPADVAGLAEAGQLIKLPGIGKAIAGKVTEFVESGQIAALEELRAQIPPTLIEVMRVPGIGPKLAARLLTELGISSLAGLEEALGQHRLRSLRGLGERSEKAIAQGLAELRSRASRRPLGQVLPLAEEIVHGLEGLPVVEKAAVAGSLRRWRETVKDVDLVVATKKPDQVRDYLMQLTLVDRILERGNTKVSLLLHGGLQIDIRLVEPIAYASALHHFTGSKDHHIALREFARTKGLSISEYGVVHVESGARHTPQNEVALYDLIGLPYIPPELREGQGEVEAALGDRLPSLLERKHVKGDLHVHSNWSDGGAPLREIASAAAEIGLEYVAICDHSPLIAVAGGLSQERLEERDKEIARVNTQGYGATLLSGVEVDILADGTLDYPDEFLARRDVVVASIHTGFRQSRDQIMARFQVAMENRYVHIIGHPTGRLLNRRSGYEVDVPELVRIANATGTALEINCSPNRLDLSDQYAKLAAEKGVMLAVNTDAHDVAELEYVHYGVAVARRAWITPDSVVNSQGLAKLKIWLQRKRQRY